VIQYQEKHSPAHMWASTCHLLSFMVQGKGNRGRRADKTAGHHPIRTIGAPPPSSPQVLCQMPFLPQTSQYLSWLGTCTKYAGLHTWWLGSQKYGKKQKFTYHSITFYKKHSSTIVYLFNQSRFLALLQWSNSPERCMKCIISILN